MSALHHWQPSHEVMGEMVYVCTKCGATVMSDEEFPLCRNCKAHNKRMKLKRRKRARERQRNDDIIRIARRNARARHWWKPDLDFYLHR